MATDQDVQFDAHQLISSSGSDNNGEKLVATLLNYYPEDLQKAQELPENEVLTAELDEKALARIAKVAGVEKVRGAVVAGGEHDESTAWVRYVYIDDRGAPQKGAFPYPGLKGSGATVEGHVSQRDRVNDSVEAEAFRHAQAKADAAAPAQSSGDPIADYEEMRATDVVAYIEANPERASIIEALERATRGDDYRKTVIEAAAKAKGDDDQGNTPPKDPVAPGAGKTTPPLSPPTSPATPGTPGTVSGPPA